MNQLQRKFKQMGADVVVSSEVVPGPTRWHVRLEPGVRIDVRRGRFDIKTVGSVDINVVDVRPKDRHLLLHVDAAGVKSKYLCGHDERDWFVAAVPENRGVKDVASAKAALKPEVVHRAERRSGVKAKQRDRRRNKGSIRQGEWFFTPAQDFRPNRLLILKDELLVRATAGGRVGKPHVAEEACRVGGEAVWTCGRHPQGVSAETYQRLVKNPSYKNVLWRPMRRNATVYVRGRITHSDHATVTLRGWHLVTMNMENQAAAMKSVVFLD